MKLVMVVSRVRLAWGYSIRYAGASAAQPALPLPPPTSIVGFYAEPLARLASLPEKGPRSVISLLAGAVYAAAAGLDPGGRVGVAVYADATRILSLVFQRKRKEWQKYAWAVQSMGAAYAPGATLYLALLLDAEKAARSLGLATGRLIEALQAAGWRLGAKEGLAAPVETIAGEPVGSTGEYESILYQDSRAASHTRGTVVEVDMWGLEALTRRSPTPSYRVFMVPASPESTPSLILPPYEPAAFTPRSGRRAYCLEEAPEGLCVAAETG